MYDCAGRVAPENEFVKRKRPAPPLETPWVARYGSVTSVMTTSFPSPPA